MPGRQPVVATREGRGVDPTAARELAAEPVAWRAQADDLTHAAAILWDRALAAQRAMAEHRGNDAEYLGLIADFDLVDVAMMLDGLALENLVKAQLVEANPALVTPEGIAGDLLVHGLTSLFRRAGINVDSQEAGVLKRLEQIITWAARYPTPGRFLLSRSGTEQVRSTSPAADHPVIERLLARFLHGRA